MKNYKLLIFISSVLFLISCKEIKKEYKYDYNPELSTYVDFLKKNHKNAKDYILELFKKNDIVILCERDHRENTQYELITEIISDPRFIKNVGNVFTEVGMRNLNPEINDFIHSPKLSKKEINKEIISLQRRCSFYPLWEKYNFYYFIEKLYQINQNLKPSEKINVYPTDISLKLDSLDLDYYKSVWNKIIYSRDSLMAQYIIDKFDSIQKAKGNRKKALIIMNYRHSFNNNFKFPNGKKADNVGRYLFDKYQGKIANVLINQLGIKEAKSDINITWRALQGGKWDASFKVVKKDNVGFDFKNTPFGKDYFDLWQFFSHNYKYQDVFTGFVYYKSPDKYRIITGVDGLIDNSFIPVYKKRVSLWKKIIGERLENPTRDSIILNEYNKRNIRKKEKIDTVLLQINK